MIADHLAYARNERGLLQDVQLPDKILQGGVEVSSITSICLQCFMRVFVIIADVFSNRCHKCLSMIAIDARKHHSRLDC